MTVMEADESDECPKTVWAPQILTFFNISNEIHSMYQLLNTVWVSIEQIEQMGTDGRDVGEMDILFAHAQDETTIFVFGASSAPFVIFERAAAGF